MTVNDHMMAFDEELFCTNCNNGGLSVSVVYGYTKTH